MEHFLYTKDNLTALAHSIVEAAHKKGVQVALDINESLGLDVNVRCNAMESVQHNHDKILSIKAYVNTAQGAQSGVATTNNFSEESVSKTLDAACQIARATQNDIYAGLPDPKLLYQGNETFGDLECFKPWDINLEAAVALGREIEGSAFSTDSRIVNSEGAGVYRAMSQNVFANSHGFIGYERRSSNSLSMVAIARDDSGMQVDYWYSDGIDARNFMAPQDLGKRAAQRALARLNPRKINTQTCPVLFEAPLAIGLLGNLIKALTGSALYRRESFLLNSIGAQILSENVQILEDPFIKSGSASSYFDDEGVATQARNVVASGVLQGYFLNTYAARRLGSVTTGNSGGSHNLHAFMDGAKDDFNAMLKRMGRGLLLTSLLGQGVNYVTGDYSRGAEGYWVENGEVQHAVSGITVAGNLREMFKDIVAIGNDSITRGNKTIGSVLIEKMRVAGD